MGGKIDDANKHLAEALRIEPNNDETHYIMGLVWRSQARPKEAERSFKKAIAINPNNAKAHGNLAIVLLQQNQIDEGERHFLEAARLTRAPVRPLMRYGRARSRHCQPKNGGASRAS